MRLDEAEFSEVGLNSVVIGLTGVLGLEARENDYSYDMPYPQLPKVEGHSTATSSGCAVVAVVASYAPAVSPMRIRLEGTYCLVGPAEWQAREQVLKKK